DGSANGGGGAELQGAGGRVVAGGVAERRRIERNLHDGAQQRLVSLGVGLRIAQEMVPAELTKIQTALGDTVTGVGEVLQELQEIARGLHPAALASGGLSTALAVLARRSAL